MRATPVQDYCDFGTLASVSPIGLTGEALLSDYAVSTDPVGADLILVDTQSPGIADRVTWWGYRADGANAAAACPNNDAPFVIQFSGGGRKIAYTVHPQVNATDMTTASDAHLPIFRYEATLNPPVNLDGEVMMINGLSSACPFYWYAGSGGIGYHVVYRYTELSNGPSVLPVVGDLAYCIFPYVPEGYLRTDKNHDGVLDLSELLRVIQFYNSGALQCDALAASEDGYLPGSGNNDLCAPYSADYNPQDWVISLSELLRCIQFYNAGGYTYCPASGTEDGYCVGQG